MEIEIKLKKTDTISVYYFGSANDRYYRRRVTTVKTFQKWCNTNDSKASDVAFILQGYHSDIQSCDLSKYIEENNSTKLSKSYIRNI
jgi:hypothetical protein